jgi:WD40 repeat protein/CheY-like chemotaxis protein
MEPKPNTNIGTVIVADDHEGFRKFVCSTIEEANKFQIVGQAADGTEAVEKAVELGPDLILLDIEMPGLSGIEAARKILKFNPQAKILFLSQESDPEVVRHVLYAGALGYVQKMRASAELIAAIHAVLAGKYFVSSSLNVPGFEAPPTTIKPVADVSIHNDWPGAEVPPIPTWLTRMRLAAAGLVMFVLVLLFVWYDSRRESTSAPSNQIATRAAPQSNLGIDRRPDSSNSVSEPATSSRTQENERGTSSIAPHIDVIPSIRPLPKALAPTVPPASGHELDEPPISPPLVAQAPVLDPFAENSSVPPGPLPDPPAIRRISFQPAFGLNRTLRAHSGWVTSVAFGVDGQLASGSWDQTVKFWDIPTAQQLGSLGPKLRKKEVQAIAFSPGSDWLAVENSGYDAVLWNTATGQPTRTFASDKPQGLPGSSWVYSIAFSADGKWLATGVDDRTIRIWNVQTGEKVRDLTAHRRPVMYMAFSPDGRWLISGDGDRTIGIWDVTTGQIVQRLRGHRKAIYRAVFSPDGRYVASASADKTIKVWDPATGQEIRTLIGHDDVVTSVIFGADGKWLGSGSWDKTIKIWSTQTGDLIQTLKAHDSPVYTIASDPSGLWLASGSEDGTINLWQFSKAGKHIAEP